MKKNILITGASSGIGEACARRLASEGHRVVLMARRQDKLESILSEIQSNGGEAFIHVADVTNAEQIQKEVTDIQNHLGHIDVVVNNAGIMPLSFLRNGKLEEAHRMVDVNVKGVLNLIYAALPNMLERDSGHFVNVSSVAAKKVFPAGSVYCGTKFAVRAISEGLRSEMAAENRKIRVTDIQPGAVLTELSSTITDEDALANSAKWEKIEFLQSDDIAQAVSYAIGQPVRVSVNEITVRPSNQPS